MNLQESRLKLRENGEKEQKCDPSTRKIRINRERKRKYLWKTYKNSTRNIYIVNKMVLKLQKINGQKCKENKDYRLKDG